LRDFGAKAVRVGVTHPVLSGPAVERLNQAALDELVVTDTLPIPEDKVRALHNLQVLSTAAMFGDAIRRIHAGRSISEMME
jgi:ribose-phosphate pyrophosphokinase